MPLKVIGLRRIEGLLGAIPALLMK